MDKLLPKLYREYGLYSNWRSFPFSIDGVKPVERRILFSTFQIAKNRLTKCARIDGHVTGNYHPHGSVYGSVVQLVRQGFLEGQGNFGCNIGVEAVGPAASRYTEVKMTPFIIDIAFKYLKYVPWFKNELDQIEPSVLPTMFPLCLIGREYTQGIGFGYKTFIPCYQIHDLYKRLQWLIGERKTKITIAPITDCIIKSNNRTLDKLLTTGQAKIDVEGMVDVDFRSYRAILKSWPPGRKFESVLKKLSKHFDSNSIGFTDLSSAGETRIVFQVLKGRYRDKIFKSFIKDLKNSVQGTISFDNIIINTENCVQVKAIDEMLLETFNAFKEVSKTMLKKTKKQIEDIIKEYMVLNRIRAPLKRCLGPDISFEETVKLICSSTKIPKKDVAELLNKYRIKKLLTLDTDTKTLKSELGEVKNNLKNVNNFVLEQYNGLLRSIT